MCDFDYVVSKQNVSGAGYEVPLVPSSLNILMLGLMYIFHFIKCGTKLDETCCCRIVISNVGV